MHHVIAYFHLFYSVFVVVTVILGGFDSWFSSCVFYAVLGDLFLCVCPNELLHDFDQCHEVAQPVFLLFFVHVAVPVHTVAVAIIGMLLFWIIICCSCRNRLMSNQDPRQKFLCGCVAQRLASLQQKVAKLVEAYWENTRV